MTEEEITKHIEKLDKVIADSKKFLDEMHVLEGKVEIVKSLRLIEHIKLYFENSKEPPKEESNL